VTSVVTPALLEQINALRAQLDDLTNRVKASEAEQGRLETLYHVSQARSDAAQQHVDSIRVVLQRRAIAAYEGNDVQLLAVFLGSDSPQVLLNRRDLVEAVSRSDTSTLTKWRAAQSALAQEQESLRALSDQQTQVAAQLKSQETQLSAHLSDLDRVVKSQIPLAGQRAPIAVNGFVFPVGQPHSFSDDFGDYRAGPPVHAHQGNDIFAPRNTPLFAVADGVLDVGEGGLGGRMIDLYTADGSYYFYAHLESWAPGVATGVKVRAGQVIGFVGDSGNAAGGATHCHFEIHPRGGAAVDPYPTLTAADKGAFQALVGPAPAPESTLPPIATDTITPLPELPPIPTDRPVD
jgi:peptidoglycan LD-endopeptidase LytH